jgi:uncharacterized Zn-finger protein
MGIIRAPAGSTAPPAKLGALAMQPFEIIHVADEVVACNGGGGALGHPMVYLNLAAEGRIECPYCSRLFILDEKRGAHPAPGAAVAPKP